MTRRSLDIQKSQKLQALRGRRIKRKNVKYLSANMSQSTALECLLLFPGPLYAFSYHLMYSPPILDLQGVPAGHHCITVFTVYTTGSRVY